MGKNDLAWEKLFIKHDILKKIESEGIMTITANEIKKFREPRLMTKFDHKIHLPEIFKQHKLSILPISRGSYTISHFNAYHEIDSKQEKEPIIHLSLPEHLQSLDEKLINSESIAINCALASGIIEDFLEDSELYSTVTGRMSSTAFNFKIFDTALKTSHDVLVNNSQIEIDAAFEGLKSLALFEAKNNLSKDFLVRQLYYPYRAWMNRIEKPVRPIFLVYSNGIFRLTEYSFDDPECYNSIKKIKYKEYSIEDTKISISEIEKILYTVAIITEPEINFPQADKFERVINLCELLVNKNLNRAEVTTQYDFDVRQTNYYTDAGRYLGLLVRTRYPGHNVFYSLSSTGKKLFESRYKQRQLEFVRLILQHKIFNETLKQWMETGVKPEKQSVVDIMKTFGAYNIVEESTYHRRASTVMGWLNWILDIVEE